MPEIPLSDHHRELVREIVGICNDDEPGEFVHCVFTTESQFHFKRSRKCVVARESDGRILARAGIIEITWGANDAGQGYVTQAAFAAVKNDFWTLGPGEYALTPRQRALAKALADIGGSCGDEFDWRSPAYGHETGTATVGSKQLSASKADLQLLGSLGWISLDFTDGDLGARCHVEGPLYAAVQGQFRERPPSRSATNIGNLIVGGVHGGTVQAAVGDYNRLLARDSTAIAAEFVKLTTDLVELVRELINRDEAQAAECEAASISHELKKDRPDQNEIAKRIKSFLGRIASTFSGTAELAEKAEKIAKFAERLGPWVLLVSTWVRASIASH